jgi:DNA-3-methyladenine glycosylase II
LSTRATDGHADNSYSIRVQAPYRLDLTVNVLRRLSSNRVDVLTPKGEYLRVLGNVAEPVIVHARQTSPETLSIRIEGDRWEHPRLLALVRRMLGL